MFLATRVYILYKCLSLSELTDEALSSAANETREVRTNASEIDRNNDNIDFEDKLYLSVRQNTIGHLPELDTSISYEDSHESACNHKRKKRSDSCPKVADNISNTLISTVNSHNVTRCVRHALHKPQKSIMHLQSPEVLSNSQPAATTKDRYILLPPYPAQRSRLESYSAPIVSFRRTNQDPSFILDASRPSPAMQTARIIHPIPLASPARTNPNSPSAHNSIYSPS